LQQVGAALPSHKICRQAMPNHGRISRLYYCRENHRKCPCYSNFGASKHVDVTELEPFKENRDEEFHTWFDEISKLAQELNISIAVLCTVGRQVFRNSAPADSPETYYRRNVLLPFLDHILTSATGPVWRSQATDCKTLYLSSFIAGQH
jgi:hypothetical protein